MRVVGWLPELPEELPEDPPWEPLVRVVGALPLELDPDDDAPDEDAPEEYGEPVLVRVTGAPEELPAAYEPPDAAWELVRVAGAPAPA